MNPSQIPGLPDDAAALHASTHQTVIFAAWMLLGLALLAGALALWGDVIAPWIARVRKNRTPRSLADTVRLEAADPDLPQEHTQ